VRLIPWQMSWPLAAARLPVREPQELSQGLGRDGVTHARPGLGTSASLASATLAGWREPKPAAVNETPTAPRGVDQP
jgi:hypothetical protein